MGARTGPSSGHCLLGTTLPGQRPHRVEAGGLPPSLGTAACRARLLPRPHFLSRDHHEEDQTGRYRDRLETQQETGVGVSEREAGDY